MRSISYAELCDRIQAGWLGKSIGGAIGAPVENHKRFGCAKAVDIWPDELLPNDDLDIQLVWLEAFQERGLFLTRRDLEEMWFDRCEYNFCEYGVFMNNIERGIHSPLSGDWNNDFFRESEGCPIRSEIWGMVCPGNPTLAAEYAKMDGELDHAGFSVEVEMFLSAAAAAAFVEETLSGIFDAALAVLPGNSSIGIVLCDMRKLCHQNTSDAVLWRRMIRRYGDRDASKAITNFAIVLAALFRHGDSFCDCMEFCYNAGWDTDCTAATAGALLGILRGAKFLPEDWVGNVGGNLSAGISVKHRTASFDALTEDTARIAVEMAASRNSSIRISGAPSVSIRPVPDREIMFEVLYPEQPVIRTDRLTPVEVVLTNPSAGSFSGTLRLLPEFPLECDFPVTEFLLQGRECRSFPLHVRWCGGSPLPDRFPVVVEVDDASGRPILRSNFGFGGARIWNVYGPYWDMWDKKENAACPFADCNPHAAGYGRDSYHQYADLTREYLDEARLLQENLPEEDPYCIQVGTDRITARDLGGFNGQGCYYQVCEIEMPEANNGGFLLARSGPCEVSLDGALLNRFPDMIEYSISGEGVDCRFTGKRQRVVVKVIRLTEHFEFALIPRRIGYQAGFFKSLYSCDMKHYF